MPEEDNTEIGFLASVFTKNKDDQYDLQVKLSNANLCQLSLLLVCVHMIEREILDAIDSIPPDFEIRR